MKKQLTRALAGFVAGLAATGVMSLVLLAARRVGALGEPPPRRLTRRLLSPLVGTKPSGRALDAAAMAAHLAFGGWLGAAFSLLPGRFKTRSCGQVFGLAVWAVNYAGLLPKVGLMPRPSQDRLGRPSSMVAAHLVYGAALALIERELSPVSVELRGKVVVVCGGSRGLGRAVARELVQRGARVAICGRSPETLQRTQHWLERFGSRVLADVCDLRDEAQTRSFLNRVARELGPVDVLIANAAAIDVGPVETLRPSDDRAMTPANGTTTTEPSDGSNTNDGNGYTGSAGSSGRGSAPTGSDTTGSSTTGSGTTGSGTTGSGTTGCFPSRAFLYVSAEGGIRTLGTT